MVKRFYSSFCDMEEDDVGGEYVEYSDYAALQASHARLLEATKRLVGSLGVMIGDPDNDGDIIYGRDAIAAAQPFTET